MRKSIQQKSASSSRIIRKRSGFTLLELLIAIVILFSLIAIAFGIYRVYIDKARLTVAISTLDSIQKTLESYHLDNNKYPASINFDNCVDDQGHTVFPSDFCDQIKNDLYSENYAINGLGYVLTAQAKDNNHTSITLTESNITQQGS
jgi:prepilin-type N-terminal cleavage/methylation domain-containing protein